MRTDYQPIFRAANSRLFDLSLERCREIELIALRSAPRPPGPRPEMLRDAIRAVGAAPLDDKLKDRCHDTLRRIYVALQNDRADPEALRMALNAYLDGQGELGAKWITLDVVLRPFG
jgi:hypothetical protein